VLLVPCLAAVGGDLAFLEVVLGSGVPLLAADAGAARRPTLRLLRDVALHAQTTASDRSRDALRAARRRGVKLARHAPRSDRARASPRCARAPTPTPRRSRPR
jgi:hypothetical protein